MSDIAIRVENLSKLYHIGARQERHDTLRDALTGLFRRNGSHSQEVHETELWALRDVSFEVKRGEVVGIIGRNGAGKSTLLKILSRITEPTSGSAQIHGRVGSLLEVGTGFHPELTGRENIFLNGAILGMRRHEIERKFDEIVAFAEMEKFLDTPVKRYSSGMYVRLAFAVAAHLEPEILLVDEVLAVGDVGFQKKCLGKMQGVANEGRTVLFVSHNMEAVVRLCSKVTVIDNGRNSRFLMPADAVKQYVSTMSSQGIGAVSATNTNQLRGQNPILKNIRLTTSAGEGRVIKTGDSLTVTLHLENCERWHAMSAGIVFLNDRQQRIAAFHTQYHSGLTFQGGADLRLVCHIPSLPLVPGTYFIEVVLADKGRPIERAEAVAQLQVMFADLFETGQVPNRKQGIVILPCKWETPA